jgi:hypothetical protein
MATKIVTKNSSTASAVPTASDLVQGELAVNVADKRLFTEDNAGAIVELGTNPSTIDINAGTIDGTTVGASSASTGAFTTLTATGAFTSRGIDDNADATAITIDSSENVGIGTASPVSLGANTHGLTINGTGNYQHLTLQNNGNSDFSIFTNGSSGTIINQESADPLLFNTSGTERMRIDSSGNVGIGMVPQTVLDLQATDNLALRFYISTSFKAGIQVPTTAGDMIAGSAVNDLAIRSQTNMLFATGGNAERMRIDSSGNVGIGTSSPAVKFDVNGDGLQIRLDGTANTSRGIMLRNTGTAEGQIQTDGNMHFIQEDAGRYMRFSTANTERMRIDSSGEVEISGIGNTSGARLNIGSDANNAFVRSYDTAAGIVIGTANAQPVKFMSNSAERMRIDSSGNLLVGNTSTSVTTDGVIIKPNGETFCSIPSLNTLHVYNTTLGSYRFYVSANGGIYNYSGNNVNLSDEREKKNIEPLESQWDSLKQWSLKKFHYNADADSENKKYGVIAQEVETHNPEVIDEFNVDDETTRMAVKEQQMMWMAIKALQEAQTRIETLEARVTELENN